MAYEFERLSKELKKRYVDPAEVSNFPKNDPYVVIEGWGFTFPRETNLVAGYIMTKRFRTGNILDAIKILNKEKCVKKFIVQRTESGLEFRIE